MAKPYHSHCWRWHSTGWVCAPPINGMRNYIRSLSLFLLHGPQSTHRVATADFWRTYYHDGKICPGWWGWGVHSHSLSLYLPSRTKLQCKFQLRGQINSPYFISTHIWTLWRVLTLRFWMEVYCRWLLIVSSVYRVPGCGSEDRVSHFLMPIPRGAVPHRGVQF